MRILLAVLAVSLGFFGSAANAAAVYAEGLYVSLVVAKKSGYHWVFLRTTPPWFTTPNPFPFPAAVTGCTDNSRGVIVESPSSPGSGRLFDAASQSLQFFRGVAIHYDTVCIEWEPGSGAFAPQILAIYHR